MNGETVAPMAQGRPDRGARGRPCILPTPTVSFAGVNPIPLVDRIRTAREHPTMQLAAVIVTSPITCPRCNAGDIGTIRGADLDGMPARRCKRCGTAFRVVIASSTDIVAAIGEHPAAPPAENLDDEADDAGDDAVLHPEDVAEARAVLEGWRVRLAAVRTRKRLDEDAPPFDEDLALLERAAIV